MTLDLTYNTDFAQVEVDEQQINLTRFNLLFPEKRPFFLENRGLFAVGKTGEVDLFFSRRIGIDDNGELVPIQGGARLTGKASGVNVGLLNMQTERVDADAARTTSRPRASTRTCANRSSVGGIFVNRTATGEPADATTGTAPSAWTASWASARQSRSAALRRGRETPGCRGREHAYSSAFEYRTRAYRLTSATRRSATTSTRGRLPRAPGRLPAGGPAATFRTCGRRAREAGIRECGRT